MDIPELWTPVPDVPKFLVSTTGKVKERWTDKEIAQHVNQSGYLFVHMRWQNRSYQKTVHRLVMLAFMPVDNPESLVVNHIDGDKHNNLITNLEWTTNAQNLRHASDNGLMPKGPRPAIFVPELNRTFKSMAECARFIGGHTSGIRLVLSGLSETYLGYTFEYA